MIAKQVKGTNFSGVLKYLLTKEHAQLIGTNMLGRTVSELSQEFAHSKKLKPDVSRAVYHASLSLPPGEHLSSEKWREVGKKYLEGMGFARSQYIMVQHKDTAHSHIHMVASRIGLDGKVVSESHDYRRSETVVRGLEVEYGLTRVKSSREVDHRSLSTGELRLALKNDVPSVRYYLQQSINEAAQNKPTMSDFIGHLEQKNIYAVPHVSPNTQHISGMRYQFEDFSFKGSQLGKAYTWSGLLNNKGIQYEQNRDGPAIRWAVERGQSRRESAVSGASPTGGRRQGGGRDRGENPSDGRLLTHALRKLQSAHGKHDEKHGGDAGSLGLLLQSIQRAGQKHRGRLPKAHFQALEPNAGNQRGFRPDHFEHILRVALSVSGNESREKVEDLPERSVSAVRSKDAGAHRREIERVREALKPFDDEIQRKRLEMRRKQQEMREKSRSEGRGRSRSHVDDRYDRR